MTRGKETVRQGARSLFGQVAVWLAATLVTALVSAGIRDARPGPTAVAPPTLTSGGKFVARIAGAALPPLPEPARPVTGVAWAVGLPQAPVPINDALWTDPDDAAPTPAADRSPALKPVRHAPRRAMPVVAEAVPPSRPAALPQFDLHLASAAADASLPAAVWSMAAGTAHALVSFGGSAVAAGTAAMGRLVP